ncbi:MAG: hypothetical protein JST64_00865 [Actinobacteria bacterium]|nr:hypothetical protein [Actinomycetota bacterium]
MGATVRLLEAEAQRSEALIERIDAEIVNGSERVTLSDLATATRSGDFARSRAEALRTRQETR